MPHIQGVFKAIRFWKTGKLELYNLATHRGEFIDLFAMETVKALELNIRLMAYLKEVNPDLLEKLLAN